MTTVSPYSFLDAHVAAVACTSQLYVYILLSSMASFLYLMARLFRAGSAGIV